MEKKCSICNVIFECDNSNSCWCMKFPKLTIEDIDDSECVCKKCLLKKYEKKLWSNTST